MEVIYRDAAREVAAGDWGIVARNVRGGERRAPWPLEVGPTTAEVDAAIRAQGRDPEGWFVVRAGRTAAGPGRGIIYMALPPECRAPVEAAIAAAEARRAAGEADPGAEERRAIEELFRRAEARRDYPGEYYRLLAAAEDRLRQWRLAYPAAAAAERREELLAAADREERLADAALAYDADGTLSPADQEAAAAEHRRRAAELRRQAEELAREGRE